MFAHLRNQVFKPINSRGFAPKDGLFGPKNLVSTLTAKIDILGLAPQNILQNQPMDHLLHRRFIIGKNNIGPL